MPPSPKLLLAALVLAFALTVGAAAAHAVVIPDLTVIEPPVLVDPEPQPDPEPPPAPEPEPEAPGTPESPYPEPAPSEAAISESAPTPQQSPRSSGTSSGGRPAPPAPSTGTPSPDLPSPEPSPVPSPSPAVSPRATPLPSAEPDEFAWDSDNSPVLSSSEISPLAAAALWVSLIGTAGLGVGVLVHRRFFVGRLRNGHCPRR